MAGKKLEDCQREAGEITILMKQNVDKVYEREGKLADLEDRTEELKNMASSFQKTATAVERKTRWEKWRWYIISAGIILLILVILIIVLVIQFGGGGGGGGGERGGGGSEVGGGGEVSTNP